MENRFIIAALVITACVVSGNALPARKRMIYYQQPAPSQWYGAPQRLMYVHYEQPSGANGRSATATSALVAGETVATGTYLEDCNQAEANVAAAGPIGENGEGVLSASGVHTAQSVAEAYPDDGNTGADAAEPPSRDLTVGVENDGTAFADVPASEVATEQQEVPAIVQTDDEAKIPRDYKFEHHAPAPVIPPSSHYLTSHKKIYVELDHSAEAAGVEQSDSENAIATVDEEQGQQQQQQEDEEEEEETDVVAPVVPISRKTKKPVKSVKPQCADCTRAASSGSGSGSGSRPPLPAGTFFPIDFGGTSGGATAIANSFSTGEGGTATSHAIAYGSPDAARGRVRPSKLH